MDERLENKAESVILKEEHPFSEEEERFAERKRVEELRPILDELDYWRRRSLYAPIVI